MNKDLTSSLVHRQNILNNPYALREIEKATRITGIPFEGKTVVLKEQVAAFFEVTLRTVENYLSQHEDELVCNGYEVIKGNRLKLLKTAIKNSDVPEIYFGNITKSPQLAIFDFRAFLNLAMLMVESERARLLRDMENISYHVAAGKIKKELLGEIIEAFLNEEMDSEVLKLKILEAMTTPER
ncbi:MAG: hypothetical protein ACLPVO_05520 [Desulfomonilaceae bacterium]